jgi:2-polyprenyl-6-methoxyphenol hydroxylase-like FAD-dependent oxidoreductase
VPRSYNERMSNRFDVCIRGDGMVGRSLALLLARQRVRVGLVAQAPSGKPDVRAYALNSASRQLLQELRCWPDDHAATPVHHMRVWGDSGGAVHFDSTHHRHTNPHSAPGEPPSLTWIVDVPVLEQRLGEAVRFAPEITVLDAPAAAALTVICEGRHSATRAELGVSFDTLPYHQQAVAARLQAATPHGGQALQWFHHGPHGLEILALLPMGGTEGHTVGLVWSLPPERAQAVSAMDDTAFAEAVTNASQQHLGTLQLVSERVTWPLQLACAQHWCGQMPDGSAWALAGDAAHNIHPLAGLGLNLGLADVAELARTLSARQGKDYWRSPGDRVLLRRYERARKAGMAPTWLACDGLQRLFAHPDGRVQSLRNWGMRGFDQLDGLKRWTIQQAMQPR